MRSSLREGGEQLWERGMPFSCQISSTNTVNSRVNSSFLLEVFVSSHPWLLSVAIRGSDVLPKGAVTNLKQHLAG